MVRQNIFDFYTLKNGVRVVLVPMRGVESVAIGAYMGVGSRDETDELSGLAHCVEHMTFRGTKTFPKTDVLEACGGLKNGWTSKDATHFQVKVPADKWRLGVEMVMSLVTEPLFRRQDLDLEKKIIGEEIGRENDVVEELVWKTYYAMRFPGQAVGRTTLGTVKSLNNIEGSDLKTWHRKYSGGDVVVVVAGKVAQKSEIRKQIEEWVGKLPRRETLKRSKPEFGGGPRVRVINKADCAQVQMALGFEAITLADPRRHALAVLNRILSYSLSGRLSREVREKRGLAYVVYSDADLDVDRGMWAIGAGVAPKNLAETIKVCLGQLVRLKQVLVPAKELDEAKQKRRVPVLFALENPASQMDWYGEQALWRPEQMLTHRQVIDQTMQVTAEEVRDIAREIFVPERVNLAVVGAVAGQREEELVKLLNGW